MSQIEPTDLLCRARRDELTAEEQRRLSASLQHSLEVRLMNEMLSQFERESNVRPGDDLLLARITARALGAPGAPEKAPLRKRRWLSTLLVAAAVLLVASLAGALLGGARLKRAPKRAVPVGAPSAAIASRLARPRGLPIAKAVPSEAAPEPPPIPVSHPQAHTASPQRPPPELKVSDASIAAELFAQANMLRRQGRGVEAAESYQRLLDWYPSSREVGPTRLALGKYFEATQPERALAHYRALARAGGALRAEALWGMAEIANRLGERSLAEQTLNDLLREYPDSPYAEVARNRAAHGLP